MAELSETRRRDARRAVGLVLMCQGAATADWVTRLPSIKASLHIGTGDLGLALAGTPLGFVLATFFVARLIHRHSSGATARLGITAAALSVILPAVAWDLPSLAAGLILLGIAFGVCDIATNVQAVGVERAYGRPVMAGMHALWSVGLIAGSLVASGAAGAGIGPLPQLIVTGVLIACVGLWSARQFLAPEMEGTDDSRPGNPTPRKRLLHEPAIILTGLIAFCAFLAEGSVSDWASVYMRDTQKASLALAALAVSVYSVGQASARLAGNRVIERVGRVATTWRVALVAAAGLTLAIVARSPALALVGYLILGIGGATIVPTAFSIAGIASQGAPAWGLSRVNTMGYSGLFVGPAAIGLVADSAGLKAALVIPVVLLVLIVPLCFRLRHALKVPV